MSAISFRGRRPLSAQHTEAVAAVSKHKESTKADIVLCSRIPPKELKGLRELAPNQRPGHNGDVGFPSACYEYHWLMNKAALAYSRAELSKAGIPSR